MDRVSRDFSSTEGASSDCRDAAARNVCFVSLRVFFVVFTVHGFRVEKKERLRFFTAHRADIRNPAFGISS